MNHNGIIFCFNDRTGWDVVYTCQFDYHIEFNTCEPHWTCGEWSECIGGKMTRICEDGCGNTRTETKDCIVVWECDAWSECINGTQTRICYDNYGHNKTETRSCEVPPEPPQEQPKYLYYAIIIILIVMIFLVYYFGRGYKSRRHERLRLP